MNLLAIVRAACAELTLPQPSAVVGSTEAVSAQMLALANSEGRDLARRYGWEALTHEATWTTVATESQGTLASIIGGTQELRYIVNDTLWNRSTGEPIVGPRAPRIWQSYKAVTFSAPVYEYRLRGGNLLILPVPTAGHTGAFEYVSRCWCTDVSGATYRTAFAADTDVPLLDDELILAGLLWRWRKAKGFDYAEELLHYERQVADAMARDGSKPVLSLNGGGDSNVEVAIPRVIGA
jgi:hypothetical protein